MKRCLYPLLLLALLLLVGCGEPAQQPEPQESMTSPMTADHSLWQQEPYYVLQFNMDSVISNAPSAAASSSRVVLSQGGTYLLSGTLEDAQLVLDVPAGETVRLVLRGVDMHSEHGPVILSKGGCTVVLVLEDGTENTLTDGKSYLYTATAKQDAAVSVEGDLLLTGGGSLTVDAAHYDAILSRGALVMAQGNVTVTAWRDGLIGSKSLTVSGGRLSVTSGVAALSVPAQKSGQGDLTLSGGQVTLISGGDGAAAAGTLSVTGGELRSAFQRRVSDAIDLLAARHSGGRIAIVSHGAALGMILKHILNAENIPFPRRPKTSNASYSKVIHFEDGTWQLLTWNDTSHLDNLGSELGKW